MIGCLFETIRLQVSDDSWLCDYTVRFQLDRIFSEKKMEIFIILAIKQLKCKTLSDGKMNQIT